MLDFLENYVFNVEKTYSIFLIGDIVLSLILMFYIIRREIKKYGYNDEGFLPYLILALLGFIPIFNVIILFGAFMFLLYAFISVLFEYIIEKINNTDKNDNRDKI